MMALQDMKININNIFAICFTMIFGSSFGVFGSSYTKENKPCLGEDRNLIGEWCNSRIEGFHKKRLSDEQMSFIEKRCKTIFEMSNLDLQYSKEDLQQQEELQKALLKQLENGTQWLSSYAESEEEKFYKLQEELDLVKKKYIGSNTEDLMNLLKQLECNLVALKKCIDKNGCNNVDDFVCGYAIIVKSLFFECLLCSKKNISSLQARKDNIQDMIELVQKDINAAKGSIENIKTTTEKYKKMAQNKQSTKEKIPSDICLDIVRSISKDITDLLFEYKYASAHIQYIKSQCKAYISNNCKIMFNLGAAKKALFKGCNKDQSIDVDRNCVQEFLCDVKAVETLK